MYDIIDRPVADLPAPERETLGRIRRWVHALTVAGIGSVSEPDDGFDRAMRALDEGSSDLLVIQRPCHSTVEETEAVLLGLWRLVRADRLVDARAVADGLVSRDHVAPLLAGLTRAAARG